MIENEQSIIPTISGGSAFESIQSIPANGSIHYSKTENKSNKLLGYIVSFIAIAIMTFLIGCGSTPEESEPVLSEDELEQIKIAECQNIESEYAEELEAAGKYGGACALYEDLIKQGIHATVLQPHCDELNHQLRIEHAVRYCISNRESEWSLWNELKDPNSLVIYDLDISVTYDDKNGWFEYYIRAEYGAANSFGGMVRNTFIEDYPVSYPYEEEDGVEGKVIDVSFIDLDRLTMDEDEWNDAIYGDWEKYSSKYKENPDNIWNY